MTKDSSSGRRDTWGESHTRDLSSQEGLNVDFQGRAGHGQLKPGDHIRMKDPQLADTLTLGKDLSTSPGEESRAWKTGGEENQCFSWQK